MTRPGLSFAQNHFSRFVSRPTTDHLSALKHYMKYVAGTRKSRLVYGPAEPNAPCTLAASKDSDWKGCPDSGRSIGGHMIKINGTAVCWSSKMQPGVKMSSTEAEYCELSNCTKSVIVFRNFFMFLAEYARTGKIRLQQGPTKIEEDNKGSFDIVKGAGAGDSKKLRHLDHHYHFARDCEARGLIRVIKVGTNEISADIMTKPAPSRRRMVEAFTPFKFFIES